MKTRVVAVLLIVVSLSGCFSHQYTIGRGASTAGKPALSEWRSHWVYGLFGKGEVDVGAVCPSGNAVVMDYHSFFNMIIGALLGWIWWPTTVEVYCDNRTSSVTLTPEQMRAIGRSAEFEALVLEFAPSQHERLLAAREQQPGAPLVSR